jgi:hypothetical protein
MYGRSITHTAPHTKRTVTAVATTVVGLLGVALMQACDSSDKPASPTAPEPVITAQTIKANDPAAAATIQRIVRVNGVVDPKIPLFANSLGNPDNGSAPGFHATGRRQINWDGVPAQFTNNNHFPANFFNVNSPRGAIYEAENGTGLRVSDNNFGDVNPTYRRDLIPFSEPKLFAPIGTNVFELRFRIPGTNTPAVVKSFGAVVVDVDKPNLSRVKYFDKNGKLIANVAVPIRKNPDEYSLVGVVFSSPVIAKVQIVLGDTPIKKGVNDVSSGGTKDVVVLDDFIYSEPQPLR